MTKVAWWCCLYDGIRANFFTMTVAVGIHHSFLLIILQRTESSVVGVCVFFNCFHFSLFLGSFFFFIFYSSVYLFGGGGGGGVNFYFSFVYAMECILLRFENEFTEAEKKMYELFSFLFVCLNLFGCSCLHFCLHDLLCGSVWIVHVCVMCVCVVFFSSCEFIPFCHQM